MGPMPETEMKDRIRGHRERLAIIGQGYVGLPLAVAFGHAGFPVTGLDTDPDKITALNAGRSYIPDVESTDLQHLLGTGRYEATSDFSILEQSDVAAICGPTPLRKAKDPDISYVVAAAEQGAAQLRPGQLVILDSTTYPVTNAEPLR